ncbi:MAG: hypothetical protein BRC26_00025 [Nanohaloarchaea archaeon QH_8_44_6]|nr:MAG: hypothetical protein BRC26_00025 [Nanohaloarchaea archaeon QH_8_44_6]
MIEGLLSPPHARIHEDYDSEIDLSSAEAWIRDEVGGFDSAVLMGVPGSEKDTFVDSVEELLTDEAFHGADIYAQDSIGEELDYFDTESIEYDRKPSRISDIEWISENISEDDDIAVFSFDYNIRTGKELDRRLEDHETFGQFPLQFDDFNDFTVSNYLKGLVPGFESFEDEADDPEKSFSYNVPETGSSNAVVLNVPFSDSFSSYGGKMRSETLRYGLAMLPYGQRMKDIGKKGLDRVMDGFEY